MQGILHSRIVRLPFCAALVLTPRFIDILLKVSTLTQGRFPACTGSHPQITCMAVLCANRYSTRFTTGLFLPRTTVHDNRNNWNIVAKTDRETGTSVFEIPQVSFAFEFESDKTLTKQSLNYHSSHLEKLKQSSNYHLATRLTFSNLMNGNSTTVLSLNCHSVVQTQTQMQTEPEAYRRHQGL